ncbi:endonuclease/exonuclease/phosphatase family protein [Pleurocapsales cyanobacterium LEGE 10410]|nr:endonuclease/exonuclease/phosphatase family protein [Pleurocapsales cyanobacterium LEGE 10410]
MFELQEPSPLSYLKQLSPTHRFGKVAEATIDRSHPNPTALDRNSIKVLSWNIAKNNQVRHWSNDFLAIVEQHQPDKIFLQEVRLCAIKQQIPELASMGWSFAPNLIDTLDNTYSGVLTATKSDRLGSQAKITQHQEPVTGTPKVSLFVEYSLGSDRDTLLTVNTHLINFVETSKFQFQLQEIEAIISQHQGAVIFSGDFNTWNRSRWLILLQMATRLGLTPAAFPPVEALKIKRFLLSPPLDYIFYRGFQQKIPNAKVINSISSSDHNPLLVELHLESD